MRVLLTQCDIAPRSDRWIATETNYGGPESALGSGHTPLAAVSDLLWALNIEDIEPQDCDILWNEE